MKTYQWATLLATISCCALDARAQTITGLGRLSDNGYSFATAMSDDGVIVVGFSQAPDDKTHPFRWSQATGLVDLGILADKDFAEARAVSNDGSVIVGWAGTQTGVSALRWTRDGGLVDLGTLPGYSHTYATGLSADGSIAVGFSENDNRSQAGGFWWTTSRGMTPLPLLPDGSYAAYATAISRDGSVIVGFGDSSGNLFTILWTGDERCSL